MSTKRWNKKPFYIIEGEALDQETIIRIRPQIEQYVRDDLKKHFKKTNITWDMNSKGNFNFKLEFYG